MADKLYDVYIDFHFGNLINDFIIHFLNHKKELCEQRKRDISHYEYAFESFQNFLHYYGTIFKLVKSENGERMLEDTVMSINLVCGVNQYIKDQYHHVLETSMDEIREYLRNYGDIILVRFTVFDDEEGDEESKLFLEDILTYWEYYENPLKYIEIKKVERKS